MFYLDAQRGVDGGIIRRCVGDFDLPVKRARDGNYKIPPGSELRVCYTSDFFIEEADEWRNDAWEFMHNRPDVSFILLTKRPFRVRDCLPKWWDTPDNVTLEVSVENQRRADERVPVLLSLPFARRGIVAAPLLGEIDLSPYLAGGDINQVSAAGENYDGARICDYDWVLSLRRQCVAAGTAFTFHGTGALFRRDGRLYRIPKLQEGAQAARAGIDFKAAGQADEMEGFLSSKEI